MTSKSLLHVRNSGSCAYGMMRGMRGAPPSPMARRRSVLHWPVTLQVILKMVIVAQASPTQKSMQPVHLSSSVIAGGGTVNCDGAVQPMEPDNTPLASHEPFTPKSPTPTLSTTPIFPPTYKYK